MKIRCSNPWSWYPLVASGDLAPGGVMPALLHGERLVVWRSAAGRVGVWNDRCPHRGMRLSMGATRGEDLICPYHGWEFASDGACSRIPAHPDLSPSRAARARLYPVVETRGYVWACAGEPATATASYQLLAGLQMLPVRSMHIGCDAETLALVLLLRSLGSVALKVHRPTVANWSDDHGITTITDGGDGAVFIAKLEFPGLISATGQDGAGQSYGYTALIQPTGDESAAVHVALVDPQNNGVAERQLLNNALVQLRKEVPRFTQCEILGTMRARFAGTPVLDPHAGMGG